MKLISEQDKKDWVRFKCWFMGHDAEAISQNTKSDFVTIEFDKCRRCGKVLTEPKQKFWD